MITAKKPAPGETRDGRVMKLPIGQKKVPTRMFPWSSRVSTVRDRTGRYTSCSCAFILGGKIIARIGRRNLLERSPA